MKIRRFAIAPALLLSLLLNSSLPAIAQSSAVEVTVRPGAYTGNWDILSETGLLTGTQTVMLEPGSYGLRVAALATGTFTFDVLATGEVVVPGGVSATGGQNVLDFITEPVTVRTNAYDGQWGLIRVNFATIGDQTVELVPGLRYLFVVGGLSSTQGSGFEIHLADDGSVTSFTPAAATGGPNSLDLHTTPVQIDAGDYAGQWDIRRVTPFVVGDAQLDLVPSLAYQMQVGDAGANPGNQFNFQITADGTVQAPSTDAVSTGPGLMAFLTRDVAIDVGDYAGSWGVARVNFSTTGSQTVSLVRDLSYSVRVANLSFVFGGAFLVDLATDGQVTVANGTSAIGGIDALDFRTVTVGVDPGAFTASWSIVSVVQQTGVGTHDLVPGLSYQLKVGSGSQSQVSTFAVADPCMVQPALHQLGAATLEVSCGPPDADQDGVPDDLDNCPLVANGDQVDQDVDGLGNACDDDLDGDGTDNDYDNCPSLANPDQGDLDGDGIGDDCDTDTDGDLVPDDQDNCLLTPNPDQSDSDGDGAGDACDPDDDQDTIDDEVDNCPLHFNPDQADFDGDGAGDACDGDTDGDGLADGDDLCSATPLDRVVDGDGCSGPQRVARLCVRSNFAVKGHYVSCVSHESKDAKDLGLLTNKERSRMVKEAAQGN